MTTGKTGSTPGRSPRHSKAAKPVTIDLKAEAVKADPIKSADTTKSTTSTAGATARSVPEAGPKKKVPDPTAPMQNAAEFKQPAASAASVGSAETDGVSDNKSGKNPEAPRNNASDSSSPAKPTVSPSSGKASEKPSDENSSDGNGQGGRDGGLAGGMTGGLIGGAVALLAMFGVQYAGLLPTAGGSSAGTETAAISSEINQLKTTVDQLSSTVSKLAVGGGEASNFSAFTGRLDALETAVATGNPAGEASPVLAEIESRISALSQRIETLGSEAGGSETDVSGSTAEVGELKTTIAALEAKSGEMSDGLSGLQSSIGEIGNQITAFEAQQTELAQSLTARIEKVEEAANAPGKDLAMARAIAISGLKTAIDRGGPFASELEAFASVSPDDPAVGDLRSFAATGVPTKAQLIEGFPDVANTMIAAMSPVAEDAGLVQRLLSSAQSVVKVRKVGDVDGDGTEAIIARLETHLKNGNLDLARTEWAKLPQEAKAAADNFGKALAARGEVEKLLAAVQIAAPLPVVENSNQAADSAAPKTAE